MIPNTAKGESPTASKPFDLDCGIATLHLSERTHVMGILNVTPDSFYDGGKYNGVDRAVAHAVRMAEEGADCIDIGGESTRPGADLVEPETEKARILPVIRELRKRIRIPISIDTRKSVIAEAALHEGANIINDVSGLRYDDRMVGVAARFQVPVVLMHTRGTPKDMQQRTEYRNLLEEINDFFNAQIRVSEAAGIHRNQIVLDPGIGFGKRWEDNFQILGHLDRFRSLECPILVGVSRKSFIGKALDLGEADRLPGTLAAIVAAVLHGAHMVRVHDVREAVQAVRIADRMKRSDHSVEHRAA